MRPTTTALLDQADAASRHAHALHHDMERLAGMTGEHVWIDQVPITRTVIKRMQETIMRAVLAGHRTLCPHLSYTAPKVAIWLAHAAGKLRCPPCADTTGRRIIGTPEDHRCDHCGQVVDTIHPCSVQLPPVVVDAPTPMAIPPSLVTFGLCPPCFDRDKPS